MTLLKWEMIMYFERVLCRQITTVLNFNAINFYFFSARVFQTNR